MRKSDEFLSTIAITSATSPLAVYTVQVEFPEVGVADYIDLRA